MANPNKFTAKEVLNKVLLDSSGNAVSANSVTSQEALSMALDATNNRLNVALEGGTISGDVTISGDLTVSGGGSMSYSEVLTGDMAITNTAATVGLTVNQSGAAYAISVNQDANNPAIYIDTEATSQHGIHIASPAITSGTCLNVSSANSLVDGRAAYFHSNSSDTTARDLVMIYNQNASATGTTGLYIRNDSTGSALTARGAAGSGSASGAVIRLQTSETTVVDGDYLGRIEFSAPLESSGTDAILAGAAIWAEADDTFAADNNSTELVFGTNTSAAYTERMRIKSGGDVSFTGWIEGNDQNVLYSSTGTGALLQAPATTQKIHFRDTSGTTGMTYDAANKRLGIGTDSPATKLHIQEDSAVAALYIDHNENHNAISIDAENTTSHSVYVESDALTTGRMLYLKSDSSSTGTRNLAEIHNDNASATGATGLKIVQDSTGVGLSIDQNGNGHALHIDSESTSATVMYVDAPTATTGSVFYTNPSALTSGAAIRVEQTGTALASTDAGGLVEIFHTGNSSSNTNNLLFIHNDHASSTGTTALKVQQDSTGSAIESLGRVKVKSDGTDEHSLDIRSVLYVHKADGTSGGMIGHDASENLFSFAGNNSTNGINFITHNGGSWGERLRIHTDGNIGIGEESPDTILHVKETIDVAYSVDNFTTDANALLKLENASTTDTAFSAIQFRTGDGCDMFIGSMNASGASNDGSFIVANQNSTDIQFLVLDNNSRISLSNNGNGSGNTIFGYLAGANLAGGGNSNLLIGHEAGNDLTTADGNVVLGYQAFNQATDDCDQNVVVGNYSMG